MSFEQYLPLTHRVLYEYESNEVTTLTPFESYFLNGESRSGKTYTSLQYVKKIIQEMGYDDSTAHKNIKIVRHFELLELAKQYNLANTGDQARRTYKEIKEAPLLIWDDFGSAKSSDFRDEIVFEIIDSRIISGAITFFTSNLSLQDIATKYSQRVAGRIQDMCGKNIFTLPSGRIKFDQSKINQMLNLYKMEKTLPAKTETQTTTSFEIKKQTASFQSTEPNQKISSLKNFIIGVMRGCSSTSSKAYLIASNTVKKDPESFKIAFSGMDLEQVFNQFKRQNLA